MRTRRLEVLWAVFALGNLLAMFALPGRGTIPFHSIWVSFALLYGLRTWRLTPTLITLGVVMAATTVAEAAHDVGSQLAEVPLMAAMFLVMVWHARRRQVAVEKLRGAAERERDFLRDASHKLRTPIAIAQGHTELIRAADSLERAQADAEVVIDELGNLARISDRVLMLVAAGHTENLRLEPSSVGSLLHRVAERWRPAAERRWQVDICEEVTLDLDRDQIESALDAIIENAVHHTRPEDRIRLRARRVEDDVVIDVEDPGGGIPAEDLPYVFDRFFGAGASARRGTGLGLAIVRSVVEAHDGRASIDSTLGRGTTVTLRIPLRRQRAQVAGARRVQPAR